MQYNDFLDTEIPYDEIPEEYLPKATSIANIDVGRQLQQNINEAFRKAAGTANTEEYAARATELFSSTKAAVWELADDYEALATCYEGLPLADGGSANVGQRVRLLQDSIDQIKNLFTHDSRSSTCIKRSMN